MAPRVKSGVADTTSVAVVECEREPLVPVILNRLLPSATPEVVVTVSVEAVPGVMEAGLKDAVAPEGKPLAERFTEPVKPLSAETLTV